MHGTVDLSFAHVENLERLCEGERGEGGGLRRQNAQNGADIARYDVAVLRMTAVVIIMLFFLFVRLIAD